MPHLAQASNARTHRTASETPDKVFFFILSSLRFRRTEYAHCFNETAGREARPRHPCFDNTIVNTLRAAARQPALAGRRGGDHRHVCALWAPARQPASEGCGAAAGTELAGADHCHLYALRAAARQPAWAGCGSAAGWELDGADHLCALRAAVWRLVVGRLRTIHPHTSQRHIHHSSQSIPNSDLSPR